MKISNITALVSLLALFFGAALGQTTPGSNLRRRAEDSFAVRAKDSFAVAPDKGRLITNPQFKVKESGGTEAVCCTSWNTSTGGTGCATYEDSCPDNTFTVECGKDGCW